MPAPANVAHTFLPQKELGTVPCLHEDDDKSGRGIAISRVHIHGVHAYRRRGEFGPSVGFLGPADARTMRNM
jgi:hypothetical protein